MPKIQCLSPQLADMIAAGEVVERPASAAKELVENAIDAGAKRVTVEIENGGMTFLRVTDDGCGMEPQDAETAFLRHATSKLRRPEDLEAIHTLGFRGEALAAISAVSRIDLLTKTPDAAYGTSLHLEAGTVTERGEAGCPDGTTIIVRDLFFNTPARLKFMKRDTIEASVLLTTVQRLALAHPEVSLRLLRDGEEQLSTPGDGELLSAVRAVLGRQATKELTPVSSRWERYELTGYVSKPNATRGTRGNQLFFVNGRCIRSVTMTTALETAYRNQLMVGRYPYCVLCLTMPEHLVDVNVHPAKTEVKFLNERDVFECIRYGVQGALDRADGRVPMTLPGQRPEQEATPPTGSRELKAASPRPVQSAASTPFFRTMTAEEYRAAAQLPRDMSRVQPSGAVLRSMEAQATHKAPPAAAKPTEKSIDEPVVSAPAQPSAPQAAPAALTPASQPASRTPEQQKPGRVPQAPTRSEPCPVPETPAVAAPVAEEPTLPVGSAPDYRIVGEVLNTYIIVEQGREVLLIDKHAAHERILFEKLRASQEPVLSQLLLEPILCKPEREEAAILLENEALLTQCGYAVSDYGDGTLAIGQLPADLDPADAAATLTALAGDLLAGKRADPTELRDNMLHTIACKAAIKGGWHTDDKERAALVQQVLSRHDLKYCPHGRPICVVMTAGQLERQFKRA